MRFDKEKDFEDALVAELMRNGWSEQVLMSPTEEELVQNWANILFLNNKIIAE